MRKLGRVAAGLLAGFGVFMVTTLLVYGLLSLLLVYVAPSGGDPGTIEDQAASAVGSLVGIVAGVFTAVRVISPRRPAEPAARDAEVRAAWHRNRPTDRP